MPVGPCRHDLEPIGAPARDKLRALQHRDLKWACVTYDDPYRRSSARRASDDLKSLDDQRFLPASKTCAKHPFGLSRCRAVCACASSGTTGKPQSSATRKDIIGRPDGAPSGSPVDNRGHRAWRTAGLIPAARGPLRRRASRLHGDTDVSGQTEKQVQLIRTSAPTSSYAPSTCSRSSTRWNGKADPCSVHQDRHLRGGPWTQACARPSRAPASTRSTSTVSRSWVSVANGASNQGWSVVWEDHFYPKSSTPKRAKCCDGSASELFRRSQEACLSSATAP